MSILRLWRFVKCFLQHNFIYFCHYNLYNCPFMDWVDLWITFLLLISWFLIDTFTIGYDVKLYIVKCPPICTKYKHYKDAEQLYAIFYKALILSCCAVITCSYTSCEFPWCKVWFNLYITLMAWTGAEL